MGKRSTVPPHRAEVAAEPLRRAESSRGKFCTKAQLEPTDLPTWNLIIYIIIIPFVRLNTIFGKSVASTMFISYVTYHKIIQN